MVKGIYLTLLMGPSVPVPVPQLVLDALTGIEVDTKEGRPSSFQLLFTLNNRSPLHTLFLLTSGQQVPQMRVIIVITLNGVPQVLADGVVTNQQVAPGTDAGHSTLRITGEDLSVLMNQDEHNRERFPGMSIEVRVAKILAPYARLGIVPAIVPPVVIDVPLPPERIPAQRGTDLAYLGQLARQVGHVFFLEPGPTPGLSFAYWGPKVKTGAPQPSLNVNMDAFTNVESLSFTFDSRERTVPILHIQDQRSKKFLDVVVPDLTLLQPPLGAIPPLKVKTEVIDASRLTMTEAMLLALSRAAASTDVVNGSGNLDVLRYGQILKARRLVGVRGAGPAFDGLHYVNGVNHSIKPGAYTQRFDLSRDGLVSTVPVVP